MTPEQSQQRGQPGSDEVEKAMSAEQDTKPAIDVTIRRLGQVWQLCPYEWGIGGYVTVQSSAGLLILCDRWQEVETGRIETQPTPIEALEVLP